MARPATSVDWILKQSHRYPLLTAAEEILLARHVQNWLALGEISEPDKYQRATIAKGKRARDRFFMSNIRLAVKVAGKYHKYSGTLSLEDLIQEGLIGLDSAIAKFDPELGYKFSTYSYWWIRQGITRAINRYSRIIHLPMQANDAIRKAMDYMQEQVRKTGKLPPLSEVAEVCKVSPTYLTHYLSHSANLVSLDQKITNREGSTEYLDIVADPSSMEDEAEEFNQFADGLHDAVEQLHPLHQKVIKARYLNDEKIPTTYNVLASDLGMTRQAVQQHHQKALMSLRLKLVGAETKVAAQAPVQLVQVQQLNLELTDPAAPQDTPVQQCAA